MPAKRRRRTGKAKRADTGKAPKRRDKAWDERLRHVGDARFVEVRWSGRDEPSWPLPKK